MRRILLAVIVLSCIATAVSIVGMVGCIYLMIWDHADIRWGLTWLTTCAVAGALGAAAVSLHTEIHK